MDSLARNYDPRATKVGRCWPDAVGCLHPAALNYGCSEKYASEGVERTSTCIDSAGWPASATLHSPWRCNFRQPAGTLPATYTTVTRIEASEPVSYFTQGRIDLICDALVTAAGSARTCVIVVTAGSSILTSTLSYGSESAMNSGQSSLETSLSSSSEASAVLGIQVISTPTTVAIMVTGGTGGDDNTAVIVGAVVGGVGGALLLAGVAFVVLRRRNIKVEA